VDSLSRLGIVARKADLHGLRGDLGDWARTAGLTEEQTEDLTLACYEVLTNVAEHAYPQDPDGTFDLEAVATEAQLDVTVRDRGTWRTPTQDGSPSSLRGRGLLLARAVADQVRVDTGPGGTTVGLRWVLPVGRSARS
jgi:anti-sigma regulatory factor (Ser/Thr protein kinase)